MSLTFLTLLYYLCSKGKKKEGGKTLSLVPGQKD